MGAGRGRLLRQLLTESVVLALVGGAAGLLIAYWATGALVAARPADIPRLDQVGLNSTVVLFTLGISLLTGLAFGLLPALQATSGQLIGALREGGRGGGQAKGSHRRPLNPRRGGDGAVGHPADGRGAADPQLRPDDAGHAGLCRRTGDDLRVTLQGDEYNNAQKIQNRVLQFEERLRGASWRERGRRHHGPAAERAGQCPRFPRRRCAATAAGHQKDRGCQHHAAILRGDRGSRCAAVGFFTEHDRTGAPPVAVVNEAAVRRWSPDGDPSANRSVGGNKFEVVGVVADVRQRHAGEPVAPANVPAPRAANDARRQNSSSAAAVIRSRSHPPCGRDSPARPQPCDHGLQGPRSACRRARSLGRASHGAAGSFAGVALALAATGIFGVMSYAVAQRSREISIRMALGARAGQVLQMIVGRAVVSPPWHGDRDRRRAGARASHSYTAYGVGALIH